MNYKINLTLIILLLSMIIAACNSDKGVSKQIIKKSGKVHPALQMLPVPRGLGVNIHFFQGKKKDLSLLEKSGVGIVRMDISWSSIEQTSGQFDFSKHDQLFRDLEKRNIRLLFIIDYGNALYDNGEAPHSDDGRQAYVRFCSALAGRYAEKNIIWELWNEPNLDHFWKPQSNADDYMAWCKAVVPAIRKNDTDACIVAPATSSFDIPFMEACFKQGLLNLVDGISVHPYRNAWLAPETAGNEYNILSILIEQYKPTGKVIPVISGEWGYSTTYLSDEVQGKYIARQWLSNMIHHIPISIWYDWHDDGQDADNAEHNFGTVTWDYLPKPAFLAMSTLIDQLRDYSPAGGISTGAVNDFMVLFLNGNRAKLALWTTDPSHKIDLGAGMQLSRVVDHLGNDRVIPKNAKLMINDQPLYLSLTEPFPPWLQMIITVSNLDKTEAAEIAQSFFDDTSDRPFINDLRNALVKGTDQERRAALHSLIFLAGKVQTSQSLALSLYYAVIKNRSDILITKQALNAIAKIGAIESLKEVESLITNPNYMQEVSNYCLNIAFHLAGNKEFRNAEKLLMKAAKVSQFRHSVDRVLMKMKEMGKEIDHQTQKALSRSAGFINRWWIAGPFPNEKDSAEHTSYFPESKIDFSHVESFDTLTARWQQINIDGIYAIIPFAKLFGKKQQAAYAYTELMIPEQRKGIFKIGSNDGVVCWLNGAKIHENLIGRSLTVDEDIVIVQLEEGLNRILLKVPNKGANWEACLRICDARGFPIDLNEYLTNTKIKK